MSLPCLLFKQPKTFPTQVYLLFTHIFQEILDQQLQLKKTSKLEVEERGKMTALAEDRKRMVESRRAGIRL